MEKTKKEKENQNLALYEQMREVPVEAQKSFDNGKFKGTDINPMWRIKKLTELFGVCGFGWYTEVVKREIIESQDNTQCVFMAINLYVKIDGEWSKPIYGEGGNNFSQKTSKGYIQTSDEAFKMAYTDAISNAAKMLGLGADIWFENDRTKYTANSIDVKSCIKECKTVSELNNLYKSLTEEQKTKFLKIFSARKLELQPKKVEQKHEEK